MTAGARSRWGWALGVAAIAIALALGACGDGEDDDGDDRDSGTPPPAIGAARSDDEQSPDDSGSDEATGSDEEAVRAVVEGYLGSLADGDGSVACEYLSPEASLQVEELVPKSAEEAPRSCGEVMELVISSVPAADRQRVLSPEIEDIEVRGPTATVDLGESAATVPLEETAEGWRIAEFEAAQPGP